MSSAELQLLKMQRRRALESHSEVAAGRLVTGDAEYGRPKYLPNPATTESCFSRITFSWLNRLVLIGNTRALEMYDFYELSTTSTAGSLSARITAAWQRESRSAKPNLRRVLFRVLGWPYFFNLANGLLSSGARIAQALLLRYIVSEFANPGATSVSIYLTAMGFTLASILQSLTQQHFMNNNIHMGVSARVGFIAAIYQKLTKLSISSISSTGQVVNLVSNDVQRLEDAGTFSAFLVTSVVECAIVFGLVWNAIGFPVVFGFATLFVFMMPVQSFFARKFGEIRKKTVTVRDERIRNLSDIFTGIQVLKLYAWEVPFQKRIMQIRTRETLHLTQASYMKSVNDAFFAAASPLMTLATFVPVVALGNPLLASSVFSTIAFYNIIRLSATNFIPKAIEAMSESNISLNRLQEFLALPEMDPAANGNFRDRRPQRGDVAVTFNSATFRWPRVRRQQGGKDQVLGGARAAASGIERAKTASNLSPNITAPQLLTAQSTVMEAVERDTLRDVSFSACMGELVAIVGAVGSGKSSLAMSVLGEVPRRSGSIEVSGRVAYVAQSPWILSGTVRDNILFGQPMDQVRYDAVVDACALRADLAQFPNSDLTPIGERGVTLSGGQRARVSLARAIYLNAEVYVLDDPLSAVDARVSRILFEQAIQGLLRDKCVLLITHQLQFARHCNRVLVLDDGVLAADGPYEEVVQLSEAKVPYLRVLREYQEAKGNVDDAVDAAKGEAGVKVRKASKLELKHEKSALGMLAVSPPKPLSAASTSSAKLAGGASSGKLGVQTEDRQIGTVTWRVRSQASGDAALSLARPVQVYYDYFRAGGGWLGGFVIVPLFLAIALPVMASSSSDWFLLYWTQHPADDWHVYAGIYGGLVGLCLGSALLRGFFFYTVCLQSSRRMFEQMLDAVLRVPHQFFVANPVGRVLNRFAKDLGLVDELLPMTVLDFSYCACLIVAIFGIVGSVAPYVLIAILPLGIAFMYLRKYFLVASREIKRLEAISRSPIYSHVSSSLEGLVTIRAFNLESQFVDQLFAYQDQNTSIYSAFMNCSRWLALRIDMITVVFLTLTVFIGAGTRNSLPPGSIGLALTYALQLAGYFQWCTRQSTEVENQMTSTERLLSYTKLEPEAPRVTATRPAADWPLHGEIIFNTMTLAYPGVATPVLSDLSLTIRAGEKVGVVGRSGAGKSSMILSLFRIVEPRTAGSVLIDGVDCSQLGVHDVRGKLSIIPQEPFLFKGSVRFNLDPNDEYTDDALWRALTSVELKAVVERLDGGLEASVQENGSNFSTGERQLFCLARAILRNSRIIIMDEPTANIDAGTDQLIQQSVRKQFEAATVITVAHRLHTIIDYHRVIVLDSGRLVEYDAPHVLLQDPATFFSRLVEQTGDETATQLRSLAADAYRRHHKAQV